MRANAPRVILDFDSIHGQHFPVATLDKAA
jgi:hypothetical protein